MKPPKYTPGEAGSTCSICGCLVADQDRHTSFHEALAILLGVND